MADCVSALSLAMAPRSSITALRRSGRPSSSQRIVDRDLEHHHAQERVAFDLP